MNFFWKFLTPKSTKKFFWKERLVAYEKNEPMIFENEIDSVINLFIEDKIAPDKFAANLIHVITGGNDRFNVMFDPRVEEILKDQTPSINSVCLPSAKRNGMPAWFYAAYPDVLAWLSKKERGFEDNLIEKSFSLFGINKEKLNEDIEEEFMTNHGYIKFEYLKNLIDSFKKETKTKNMETSTKNI
ncbi:hypothetical protein L6274_01075 [Candidatus Parcubacteria bacterium]|nr:hypothetical protein [Candidatus Parcubacteria bacterium]